MYTKEESEKMRELLDYGWSCCDKGIHMEAVDAFREVFDNIPFDSRGELKQLLEEAYRGLCELHSSEDEYTWECTGVIFDYMDWCEDHIKEVKHNVFAQLSNNEAVDSEDLAEVKELFDTKLYNVCLIGTRDETSVMEEAMGGNYKAVTSTNVRERSANCAVRLYTIDIDGSGVWRNAIRNESYFNAVVLAANAPHDEIIRLIDECGHLQGVPVLVNVSCWPSYKRTDRLMYCSEHLCEIKAVLELYCKASLVSMHIQLPFEPKKRTVLHTDDVKFNLLLASKMMEHDGYISETAFDNDETITKMEALNLSLLISDINRVNGDGYELVERIRGDKRYKHLPVMALSASVGYESNIKMAMDMGFTATVCKPAPFNVFIAIVRQLVMLSDYMRLYDKIVNPE